jgi:glutamine phosphoribosylpyrophosphate amidotransferase
VVVVEDYCAWHNDQTDCEAQQGRLYKFTFKDTCTPIVGSCCNGIDIARIKLLSCKLSFECFRKGISADSLIFLLLEKLQVTLRDHAPTTCYTSMSGKKSD